MNQADREKGAEIAGNYIPENADECALEIAEALAAERRKVLSDPRLKAIEEYFSHDAGCILLRWEAGEPTADGGYRSKYAGKWYQTKPVNESPECNCGGYKAFSDFQELLKEVGQ